MEVSRSIIWSLHLLALVVVVVASSSCSSPPKPGAAARGYVGDVCDDGRGVCRMMNNCPAALKGVESNEWPKICSYQNFTPIVCCPVNSKATRMCMKYGEAVTGYIWSFSIVPKKITCDLCVNKGIPFVVGGVKAISNEFPHMALIGYGTDVKNPEWGCGGSLISKRYVLTAAHCLKTIRGEARVARLGELNIHIENELNKHVDYVVESRIAHPKYVESQTDDIGLLLLKQDVNFTASIRPACLNVIPETRDVVVASGWGYIDWQIQETNDHLMKVKLPVKNAQVCHKLYEGSISKSGLPNGFQDNSMICAGNGTGRDTCRGDSGGPLQMYISTPRCMYNIVGVTIFGKASCGSAPAVYARVSHYIPWIESIVWADEE